jgi:hypothetical protein
MPMVEIRGPEFPRGSIRPFRFSGLRVQAAYEGVDAWCQVRREETHEGADDDTPGA